MFIKTSSLKQIRAVRIVLLAIALVILFLTLTWLTDHLTASAGLHEATSVGWHKTASVGWVT